jgi:hypothetical protein
VPAADDSVWGGHRYINALACLNGAGAEQLERYSHILRTDVDTFLTPAWNTFFPASFTIGNSTYANDDVPQRIQALAATYGLTHRGMTNIHTTWYGPTAVVRRVAAFAEAGKVLGYTVEVPLSEGLQRMVSALADESGEMEPRSSGGEPAAVKEVSLRVELTT